MEGTSENWGVNYNSLPKERCGVMALAYEVGDKANA
ncbi:unnamed protein product [Rhodiola kirilowii]